MAGEEKEKEKKKVISKALRELKIPQTFSKNSKKNLCVNSSKMLIRNLKNYKKSKKISKKNYKNSKLIKKH